MGLLILEAVGDEGERLALAAADLTEIPVGWDSDQGCATYDSDDLPDPELEAIIFDALGTLNKDWHEHLRATE